jgi:two-component system chemotaxis response regulator CheY
MKILIVDDDAVCRRVLKEILSIDPEHQLTEAADGSEAWALLDNPARYFDVMFLDVTMPEPDGLALLARIRESQILRSLRIVMCTSSTDKVTITKAIQLGARHFIVKPATAALVQAKLKQVQAEIATESASRAKLVGVVST